MARLSLLRESVHFISCTLVTRSLHTLRASTIITPRQICTRHPGRWFTGRKHARYRVAAGHPCPMESRIPLEHAAVENPKRRVILLPSSPHAQWLEGFRSNCP